MLILLLLLTLAASPGDATLSLLGRHELDCPVCQQVFTTITCTQTNRRGGVDRDLFARAIGPQPEFYRVSTCPKCGYSGYATDFDPAITIPPDVRIKILEAPRLKLPPGFGPTSDPREMDAGDRYALAMTCYQWLRRSDEAIGWLCLRAAWVARETGAILPPEPRLARVMGFIERWRPPLSPDGNQFDVEMQIATRIAEALARGQFNRYQRPYVELALALILRRHGENRQASPLLDRLRSDESFPLELRESIDRMRATIVREQGWQGKAASHFERALLAEQVSAANRGSGCYVLGELLRRTGRDTEALAWYDRAIADPALPPELRNWAQKQRAWTALGTH